jgi:hypothetical protein
MAVKGCFNGVVKPNLIQVSKFLLKYSNQSASRKAAKPQRKELLIAEL